LSIEKTSQLHAHVKISKEMFACVVSARQGLAQVIVDWQHVGCRLREQYAPQGFTVLARARRARHPGVVFARAGAIGEVDPLTDVDSRLLVGLSPT
jgi:hypothetical protein